ncbi:MAG: M67 family metallopeptidase [Chloroflexi bacterium]|nr:M67 family metallopeptidase [Chloroflexota bacterium]MCY4246283.1 M67 family metallopeptidase [Chloroflexota bacterium]
MRIAYPAARTIVEHAAAQSPCEACGLLAGKGGLISLTLPVANSAAMPEQAFALAPDEHLRRLKQIDERGLDWLGVYHSHPTTPPIPSQADRSGAADSSLLQLIVSLAYPKPRLKLWRVDGLTALPLELDFADAPSIDEADELTRRQQMGMLAAGALSLLALLVIAIGLLPPVP